MSFTEAIPIFMMMFLLVLSGFFMGVIVSEWLKTHDAETQAREDLSKLSNEELSALIVHGRPGSQRSLMAIDELIERNRAIKREASKLMERTR